MSREHRGIDADVYAAQHVETNPQQLVIDRLANQIRSLYCICFREFTGKAEYGTTWMPAWDGDPEGLSGRRTKNVWPKIAVKVLEIQADPFQYVRSQFYFSQLAQPPQPNTFISDNAVQKYESYRLQARKDLEAKVSSDDNQIQIGLMPFEVNLRWSHEAALDYALRSRSCGASALIRYCHAARANLPVASEFRERALAQYMFQMDDYDAVLKDRIPVEFRDEAIRCRERLVGS